MGKGGNDLFEPSHRRQVNAAKKITLKDVISVATISREARVTTDTDKIIAAAAIDQPAGLTRLIAQRIISVAAINGRNAAAAKAVVTNPADQQVIARPPSSTSFPEPPSSVSEPSLPMSVSFPLNPISVSFPLIEAMSRARLNAVVPPRTITSATPPATPDDRSQPT